MAVYGPRQPSEGAYAIVTGVFLKQHEQGQNLTIEGDGSHFRDFIHVSDIARGLVMAYQNPEARGVTVNLGSGDAVSIKEAGRGGGRGVVHLCEISSLDYKGEPRVLYPCFVFPF